MPSSPPSRLEKNWTLKVLPGAEFRVPLTVVVPVAPFLAEDGLVLQVVGAGVRVAGVVGRGAVGAQVYAEQTVGEDGVGKYAVALGTVVGDGDAGLIVAGNDVLHHAVARSTGAIDNDAVLVAGDYVARPDRRVPDGVVRRGGDVDTVVSVAQVGGACLVGAYVVADDLVALLSVHSGTCWPPAPVTV